MAKKNKKDTKVKVKRKVWFNVIAPSIFNSREIGETYLEKVEQGVGRKMTVSLRDLTGSMRDQNVRVKLALNEVKANSLHSTPIGYSIVPTFVKRLVRKRTSRLDDVFTIKTKDGKPVIVKMLIVTYGSVNKSMATTLRMKVRSLMKADLSKNDFESFISRLVSLKVQHPIKKIVNKFFPIKEVLVRSVELVDEERARRIKESEVKEVEDTRVKVETFDDMPAVSQASSSEESESEEESHDESEATEESDSVEASGSEEAEASEEDESETKEE